MPDIQIILRVTVIESLLKDKQYWLFRWQLNNRSAELKNILDGYSEEMAHLLFKNLKIITKR